MTYPPSFHETHVVALSGGKDSTALALRLAEIEPREYIYVCTPTGNEPDDMFTHWRKLGELLGKPITPVMHPLGLKGLIRRENALPNWRQRWCTRILKIETYRAWLLHHIPVVSYVGLRADEEGRVGGVYDDVDGVTMRFPLREWGWGEAEVRDYLHYRGVTIPARTDCDWCFFQRLDEWYSLWTNNPSKFLEAEGLEALTGHTFRSPSRDTWPAGLQGLRREFEAGRVPKQRASALKSAQCRVCTL